MAVLKESLSGIFPPVMTPFINGKIDYDGLAFNIERMNKTALRGYMPLGSNGEFRSLTGDESIKVIKTIARTKSADKTLMAGTGRESAWATIEFTKKAADAGADFASVLTPHYYAKKMEDENLIRYFTEVADASPIPVLMYCAPAYAAGVKLSRNAVTELSKHPNIAGMKDTSKEDIDGYVRAVTPGAEFYVLAGTVTKFLTGLMCGAVGGVLSLANYFPELCCELQALFNAGKTAEAEALSARLVTLNEKTTGAYGVAGVKAAMNIMGYRGGEPRVPLLPLNDGEMETLRNVLKAEGFLK
ncbi:MAG: dihydrodipicolinate synthase family protein [Treponema sp.]|jgi:4-hydroxy-2-oxoglutarate aldolase|nr:dihydrodipicolinate synthase family protein [Treponema sp.]